MSYFVSRKRKLMGNLIISGRFYLFASRFILQSRVRVVIEQTGYRLAIRHILFGLVGRKLFYRFFLQEILWSAIGIKTPVWFLWLILLFISRSSTISIVGEENLKKVEEEKQKVLFAFWHGHYTLLLAALRITNAVALVNWSFRGSYIAQLFSTFNYRIVQTPKTGSSIRELMSMIKQGHSGFIAVDGPRGPARQTKPGIIYIAQKTGAKIVPLTVKAHRGVVLKKRWDNHFIPFPCNHLTVYFGEPIEVSPEDCLEVKEGQVNRSLLTLMCEKKLT